MAVRLRYANLTPAFGGTGSTGSYKLRTCFSGRVVDLVAIFTFCTKYYECYIMYKTYKIVHFVRFVIRLFIIDLPHF